MIKKVPIRKNILLLYYRSEYHLKHIVQIGPTHHSGYCRGPTCTKSSLDFAPSLFMSFGENFNYFGSRGFVVAAHRGRAYRLSQCKVALRGHRFQTFYSHVHVTVANGENVQQGDVIGFVETRREHANCNCNPGKGKSMS